MRNWRTRFALVCATISLWAAAPAGAQPAGGKTPALVVLDSDLAQWQSWVQPLGWRVLSVSAAANAGIDAQVQAAAEQVSDAIQSGSVDPLRVYVAGRGEAAAAVFYTVSREPDLWAAALAIGGSPRPAIDTDRLYAANVTNVPLLWISSGADDQAMAERLHSAGIPIEWRAGATAKVNEILQWLGSHAREPFPASIDCETNSPAFASCYWIRMTKFDPNERNDVLPSTRMPASIHASLDLGGFGFKTDDSGPGVLVAFLLPKYSGPLRIGDRIVALDGREIPDARRYVEIMSQITEERPATVMVQRGKVRVRIETRIILPPHAPATTARVQAQYLPAEKAVQIVSRTVTEMRVTIPAEWVPATLDWNGVPLEKMETPGCRLLTMEKELEKSGACP